jgi:spore coat protein CotH
MKWWGSIVGLIAAGCLLGRTSAAVQSDAGGLPAADLFQQGLIPRLRIELSSEAKASLQSKPRTYVSATVREGTRVYTNVSIRLKGGPGSFRPLNDRPAFTVNFGRLNPGQKFHGLRKLHLNNSVQDSIFLSEKICREMFEAAGVPSPRAGHAVVEFDGRVLGLYVLVEGIDKQFLGRYFNDTKGNLYDGHSQNDVTQRMRTNSGENPKDQSALRALAAALRETDLQQRLAAVNKILDLDRFISFIAMEVIVCHWDGYALNRNNFRIYHDRAAGKLVFLPHGLDQTFQRLNTPALPTMAGAVAKGVLEIPEVAERYRARQLVLLTNVFLVPPLALHVSQLASNVNLTLQDIDPGASGSYLSRASTFRRRIRNRLNSLQRQLSATPTDTEPARTVKLPGREAKVERDE